MQFTKDMVFDSIFLGLSVALIGSALAGVTEMLLGVQKVDALSLLLVGVGLVVGVPVSLIALARLGSRAVVSGA